MWYVVAATLGVIFGSLLMIFVIGICGSNPYEEYWSDGYRTGYESATRDLR
jgi:hypothetical protein